MQKPSSASGRILGDEYCDADKLREVYNERRGTTAYTACASQCCHDSIDVGGNLILWLMLLTRRRGATAFETGLRTSMLKQVQSQLGGVIEYLCGAHVVLSAACFCGARVHKNVGPCPPLPCFGSKGPCLLCGISRPTRIPHGGSMLRPHFRDGRTPVFWKLPFRSHRSSGAVIKSRLQDSSLGLPPRLELLDECDAWAANGGRSNEGL